MNILIVDEIERPMHNSLGRLIHPTETGIENFWRWFGSSKAVDGRGRPLVVYHGTRRQFDSFEVSRPIGAPGNKTGVYFTADKSVAAEYAQDVDGATDEKSRIIAAYIRIESDADGEIKDNSYSGREFVVFDPACIQTEVLALGLLSQESIDVDGIRHPVHNSEGQRIHVTDAGIRNFWRWFGESQVVDTEGRPIVVFHGPTKGRDFDEFRVPAFFTDSQQYAAHYLDEADTESPLALYLRIKAPIAVDASQHDLGADIEERANDPAWVAQQIRAGRDGFIIKDGDITDYVAFHANQIKSAMGNSGTFNRLGSSLTDAAPADLLEKQAEDRTEFSL